MLLSNEERLRKLEGEPISSPSPKPHWYRHEWTPEDPACVRCGKMLLKRSGENWQEIPELNLCHFCAIDVIKELMTGRKMP